MSTSSGINRKRNVTTLSLKQMLRRTNSSLKLRLSCKMDSDYGKSLEADDDATSITTSRLSEAEFSDDQSTSVPSNQSSTEDVPSASIHHLNHETSGITHSRRSHGHSCISTKSNGSIKRKLHFAKTVRVCLIPSRGEYTHIYSDLWWTVKECENFKKDAYAELKDFIEVNKCSVKDGMFAIYQPTEEEEAEFHHLVNSNNNNNHNNNNNDNTNNHSILNGAMIQKAADSTLYSAFDKWACDNNAPHPNFLGCVTPSSSPHQHDSISHTSTTTSISNSMTPKDAHNTNSSCPMITHLNKHNCIVFNNGTGNSSTNNNNSIPCFSPCHNNQHTISTTTICHTNSNDNTTTNNNTSSSFSIEHHYNQQHDDEDMMIEDNCGMILA